jgi:hypothetical protein
VFQLRGKGGTFIRGEIDHGNLRAKFRQPPAKSLAKNADSAGNDGGFSSQIEKSFIVGFH